MSRKKKKAPRFDAHSDWCPMHCVVDADADDILRCWGEFVNRMQLNGLKVGQSVKISAYEITRTR